MLQVRLDAIPRRLLICGASARAAAFSALRAGIEPICADLFADQDVCRVARTVVIDDYPRGLTNTISELPPAPWIYTGALENYPRTIAEIARRRTLLGNGPETLARVRDPLAWLRCLRENRLPILEARAEKNPPPRDGTWICKPLQSAGGANMQIWDAQTPPVPPRRSIFYQRLAEGDAYSALFLAFPGGAELIGVTRQLIGIPELNAAPFAYCGSIGPVSLPESIVEQLQKTGRCLGEFAEMRGLFGCDFLYDGTTAWPTEINPRYTASAEIYERCWDVPLLSWHSRACLGDFEASASHDLHRMTRSLWEKPLQLHGKAILFACEPYVVPDLLPSRGGGGIAAAEEIADVPVPNSTIPSGRPICTVFAAAGSVEECLAQLKIKSTTILKT